MVALTLALPLALIGCGAGDAGDTGRSPAPVVTSMTTPPKTPSGPATTPPRMPPAHDDQAPPRWLGKRVLPHQPGGFGEVRPTPPRLRTRAFTLPDTLPMLPGHGFNSLVTAVPTEVLARSSWAPGCPVQAKDLRWVRLTFWGFDDRRHTGELLVHRLAARPLVAVFTKLYDARFPIEQMTIATQSDLDAPPTGDGNGTGAFACRPVTGGSSYSQHAYGLAVDVNPFQNPYTKGDVLLPELAGSYLDRSWKRPGMILPGGSVLNAFASVGWAWGGDWHSLKDRHHFSANGR